MDESRVAKRRRLVTTCSECHRRKQKCDRRKPCNICLIRKVPDQCSYSDPSKNSLPSQSGEATVSVASLRDQENGSPPTSIAEQIGYSPLKGRNVYMDLQHHLLEDEKKSTFGVTDKAQESIKVEPWEVNFWALASELPSTSVVDDLLDIYHVELSWYTGFLEHYYLQRMHKSWQELCGTAQSSGQPLLKDVPRDVLYFTALLFQICAVVLYFMPADSLTIKALDVEELNDRNRLSERYNNKGMELMDLLGRHKPSILGVQHDFMKALWLKYSGKGTESWHALSNSIRQANNNFVSQSELNYPPGKLKSSTCIAKRGLIKAGLLQRYAHHMSSMLGRPRLINLDDCDIQSPIDCKFPDDPSTVVSTMIQNKAVNEAPTQISGHLFRYNIAHLIHEMKANGLSRRYPKDYTSVQTLHEKAINLMEGLPAFLRYQNPDTFWDNRLPWIPRQREQMFTNGISFLLTLHRPHIHSSPKSRRTVIQAATSILDSQQRFFELTPKHQYKKFGLAFFTINAGFHLSSTSIMYPTTDREMSRKVDICLQQGIKRLEVLQNHNAIAGSSLKLLRHCYQLLKNAPSSNADLQTSIETSNGIPKTAFQSGATESLMNANACEVSEAIDNFNALGAFSTESPEQLIFPSTAELMGFSNNDNFDSSYWIEQMDQIPFVSMDQPILDTAWDFPFMS